MHASRIHRGCTRAWRLYRVAFILKVWVGNAELLSSQLARVPNGKKHKQKAQSSQKSGKSEKQNNIKKWLGRFNHSQKCWNPDKVRSHCQETGLVLLFVLTPIEALNLALDLFRGNYIHYIILLWLVGFIVVAAHTKKLLAVLAFRSEFHGKLWRFSFHVNLQVPNSIILYHCGIYSSILLYIPILYQIK